MSTLDKALSEALEPHIDSRIVHWVSTRLDERVRDAVDSIRPTTREVIVTRPNSVSYNVGRQHEKFATLVQVVNAGCSCWLTGPAGSGKTIAAEKAAEALGMPFSSVSIGPQSTQAHLFGYMDATGTYRGTQVRERFENGGLLLLDEIDRGNPGVLTALNALLANHVCAFPDGMVSRHETFRIVAAANTIGMGADRQYVGALQLDAATLDRFVVLDWNYDDAFESELANAAGGKVGLAWAERMQALRNAAAELKIRHIISPRATLNGIRLLNAGIAPSIVEAMTVWRGLDDSSRDRILTHAKLDKSIETPAAREIDDIVSDGEADAPDDSTPTPNVGACPRCGRSSSVLVSKINLGYLVCWKKRHGCGHKWQKAA